MQVAFEAIDERTPLIIVTPHGFNPNVGLSEHGSVVVDVESRPSVSLKHEAITSRHRLRTSLLVGAGIILIIITGNMTRRKYMTSQQGLLSFFWASRSDPHKEIHDYGDGPSPLETDYTSLDSSHIATSHTSNKMMMDDLTFSYWEGLKQLYAEETASFSAEGVEHDAASWAWQAWNASRSSAKAVQNMAQHGWNNLQAQAQPAMQALGEQLSNARNQTERLFGRLHFNHSPATSTTSDSSNSNENNMEWRGELENEWNKTAQTSLQLAHKAWSQLQKESQLLGDQELLWWNQSVHTEQEWSHHLQVELQTLGHVMQGWWNQTETEAANDTVALEGAFRQWYDSAHSEEKLWWNDTVQAYHRLQRTAARQEQLWWRWTLQESQRDWNRSVSQEERMWNATQDWFRRHAEQAWHLLQDENTQPLLYLNSSQAYALLMNGYGWYDYSSDFFLLSPGWDVQLNQAYCGVASAAATLNSLRPWLPPENFPVDPVYSPYHYATQQDLMHHDCVRRHVVHVNDTFDGILSAPGGLSLIQVQYLLQCFLSRRHWSVQVRTYTKNEDSTNPPSSVSSREDEDLVWIDSVRKDLSVAVRDPSARVIINYDRSILGQHGYGHFSPVVSYSPSQDAFLIMDVAKYKYPPVWVPTAQLVVAMNTIDPCGDWDFPHAQDALADELHTLSINSTRDQFEQVRHRLKCKATYRGYIIVRAILDAPEETS